MDYLTDKELEEVHSASTTMELVLINQFPNDPWMQIISAVHCALELVRTRPETVQLFEQFMDDHVVDLTNAPGFHVIRLLKGFVEERNTIMKNS